MKMLSLNRYALILATCFIIGPFADISNARTRVSDLDKSITRCEKVITYATEIFEKGKITKGEPIAVKITPMLTIRISKENFENDMEKLWAIYYRLVAERKELMAAKKPTAEKVVKKVVKKKSRLDAMREEEEKTTAFSPEPKGKAPIEYDLYQDYQTSRQERISSENQAAEADIRAVISERQTVQREERQRLSRKGQLQAQASMWQSELDKQASGSARVAAAWDEEHSVGGYARRFLGTVIQTTVGSFTGGLFGTVGSNAANKAVNQLFPNYSNNRPSSSFQQNAGSGPTGGQWQGSGYGTPKY